MLLSFREDYFRIAPQVKCSSQSEIDSSDTSWMAGHPSITQCCRVRRFILDLYMRESLDAGFRPFDMFRQGNA